MYNVVMLFIVCTLFIALVHANSVDKDRKLNDIKMLVIPLSQQVCDLSQQLDQLGDDKNLQPSFQLR